jgi:putative photosynthetic complex assembly protein
MQRPTPPRGVSPWVKLASGLLILSLVVYVVSVPTSGHRQSDAQVVSSRALVFRDQPDGGVLVVDGQDGSTVTRIAPGEDGFVRGMLRALGRERRLGGADREVPFSLTAWSTGRLTLEDPTSGTALDLAAYGPTNAEAFMRFLDIKENQR